MKRLLHIVVLILMGTGIFHAQTKADTKDAVNAKKVAFITKEMNLTADEAEKLWPLYNEFEQKKEDARKERIKARKKFAANADKLTEKEIEVLIDLEMEVHQKETDLQKERHKRLKKILSMKKIAMLYKAEEDFKIILLKDACDNLKTSGGKGKEGGSK